MLWKIAELAIGTAAAQATKQMLPEEVTAPVKGAISDAAHYIYYGTVPEKPKPVLAPSLIFTHQPFSHLYGHNPLELSEANLEEADLSYAYCDKPTNFHGANLTHAKLQHANLLLAYTLGEDNNKIFCSNTLHSQLPAEHQAILTIEDASQYLRSRIKQSREQKGWQPSPYELTHMGWVMTSVMYLAHETVLSIPPAKLHDDLAYFEKISAALIEHYPSLSEYKTHYQQVLDPAPHANLFSLQPLHHHIIPEYISEQTQPCHHAISRIENEMKATCTTLKEQRKQLADIRRKEHNSLHDIAEIPMEDSVFLPQGISPLQFSAFVNESTPAISQEMESVMKQMIDAFHTLDKTFLQLQKAKAVLAQQGGGRNNMFPPTLPFSLQVTLESSVKGFETEFSLIATDVPDTPVFACIQKCIDKAISRESSMPC